MNYANTPLRELTANAEVLAESLECDNRPKAAALVRELVARVVPTKLIPTGKNRPKLVIEEPEPIRANPVSSQPVRAKPIRAGGWCDQCDKRVTEAEAQACRSRFCKAIRKG